MDWIGHILHMNQGSIQGVGVPRCSPTNHQIEIKKKKHTDFVDTMIYFYVIYLSAEIRHWNELMSNTLEF